MKKIKKINGVELDPGVTKIFSCKFVNANIAGFIKLYSDSSNQDEIIRCIDSVENTLKKLYTLQYK